MILFGINLGIIPGSTHGVGLVAETKLGLILVILLGLIFGSEYGSRIFVLATFKLEEVPVGKYCF